MTNYAKINYDTMTITVYFREQTFEFDLKVGDVGNYLNSTDKQFPL